MTKEKEYKRIIRERLSDTVFSGYIPELGRHISGKVRDVHFTSDKIGSEIVMVSSDRVSCFDHVLSRQIPFKGKVLNKLTRWAFKNTEDIVKNALIRTPHDNVLVQKRMKKIPVEFVVRGYVWGSMAEEYEKGKREFCGIDLPDGLLRYQKLEKPLFTPATKEEFGEHDINVSFEHVADMIGEKLATRLRDISIKLYERASQLAAKKGMIFIDTKYEFGLDENDEIHLIDEANTPDSSRYARIEEYDKYDRIEAEMKSNKYKDVTELIRKKPELKVAELSKQFVRDVLVEGGFSGYSGEGSIPDLKDDDVVETSWRYISLYEELTGETFDFGSRSDIRADLIHALACEGLITGALVVIVAGSDSDRQHVQKIRSELEKYGIPSLARVCSAHKQPAACMEMVENYNSSIEPMAVISIAGGTDALSGVLSFHSLHPVISCPPGDDHASCLHNPPGSSNSLILRPKNAARHCAQILGIGRDTILEQNQQKVKKLIEADETWQVQ